MLVLSGSQPPHQPSEGALALPPDARREGCPPLVRRGGAVLVDVQAVDRYTLTGLPGVARPQGPQCSHGSCLSVDLCRRLSG
jgi:hypothetical protein